MKKQLVTKKNRDTRIPASVHHIGRVTVTIYDEEAYQAHILQYYGDEQTNQPLPLRRRSRPVYPKLKPIARYNWVTPVKKEKSIS